MLCYNNPLFVDDISLLISHLKLFCRDVDLWENSPSNSNNYPSGLTTETSQRIREINLTMFLLYSWQSLVHSRVDVAIGLSLTAESVIITINEKWDRSDLWYVYGVCCLSIEVFEWFHVINAAFSNNLFWQHSIQFNNGVSSHSKEHILYIITQGLGEFRYYGLRLWNLLLHQVTNTKNTSTKHYCVMRIVLDLPTH